MRSTHGSACRRPIRWIAGAASDALAPLLAANLDGFAFRKELVKLTGELGERGRRAGSSVTRRVGCEARSATSRELKREIERLGAENRVLAERKAALDLLPQGIRKYLLRRALRARP